MSKAGLLEVEDTRKRLARLKGSRLKNPAAGYGMTGGAVDSGSKGRRLESSQTKIF